MVFKLSKLKFLIIGQSNTNHTLEDKQNQTHGHVERLGQPLYWLEFFNRWYPLHRSLGLGSFLRRSLVCFLLRQRSLGWKISLFDRLICIPILRVLRLSSQCFSIITRDWNIKWKMAFTKPFTSTKRLQTFQRNLRIQAIKQMDNFLISRQDQRNDSSRRAPHFPFSFFLLRETLSGMRGSLKVFLNVFKIIIYKNMEHGTYDHPTTCWATPPKGIVLKFILGKRNRPRYSKNRAI